jgi:hypothetical protein
MARRAKLLRFIVATLLRNVEVQVSDAKLDYVQTGEPGPVLSEPKDGMVDCICVTVRDVTVLPVSGSATSDADRAVQPSATEAQSRGQRPPGGPSDGASGTMVSVCMPCNAHAEPHALLGANVYLS